MSENKEVFNIADDTKMITIVHKKGLDEMNPYCFNNVGRIDSVTRFINSRLNAPVSQTPNTEISIINANYATGSIQLIIEPNNRYGNIVTGQIHENPDLDLFYINKNKLFGRDELLKLIRFNAYRIQNTAKLIDSLKKLNISANITSKNSKDNRGNVEGAINKVVTSDIPESFVLRMPIFKSMQDVEFMVDIVMETTDANVKFWLESTELAQLLESERKRLIDEEIDKIEELGFLVIYLS